MTSPYPTSLQEIAQWTRANGRTQAESRFRFAQYSILRAIAADRDLSSILVFKGGNALDFLWMPNRSTRDLDFSVDMDRAGAASNAGQLRHLIERALLAAESELGIALLLQKFDEQPPGPSKRFKTFQITVGYALPTDERQLVRIRSRLPSVQVVPVDISLNEPICADREVDIGGMLPIRVSELEDIVAEKLRALLQQSIRNRTRRQDLLDIAVILDSGLNLDRTLVAEFLIRKANAREVPVSRTAFRDAQLRTRASDSYDELRKSTREQFHSFDAAYSAVMAFVDELALPE